MSRLKALIGSADNQPASRYREYLRWFLAQQPDILGARGHVNHLERIPTAHWTGYVSGFEVPIRAVEAYYSRRLESWETARSGSPVGPSPLAPQEKQSGVAMHFANAYSVALMDVDPA